jgi:hypothetical protein
MAQTCTRCNRANPAEAIYCYFDGFVLVQHGRNGGPVAVGAQPFGNPFVFPTGRSCRNFNELSLACQEEWAAARDLLQQGFLESFLGGLGRVDLAHAAREAQRFPDKDLALDQLLSQLPGEVLAPPKLRVEPLEINLGTLKVGDGRYFEIRLENQGMRLLHGSIVCADGDWLTLGDAPGVVTKHFQFGHEQMIPVRLCPDRLRASSKTLETTLVVESNGGTATVVVRADVPIKAFPLGVLAGSRSPRQVAEKAKAHPKDAAGLFEDGTVAEWYMANGWKYPVQGPAASGLGAVQQFFEALGLTPPPKVEINKTRIDLEGSPGETIRTAVELRTQEKRPIYAHATSSEPWLEVSRAKLSGRVATINMAIPSVPDRPGHTLIAQLTVQSNGSQRFVIPVRLVVGGAFQFGEPAEEVETVVEAAAATAAVDLRAEFTAKPKEPAFSVAVPVRPRSTPFSSLFLLHAVPALLLVFVLGAIGVNDLLPQGSDQPPVSNPLKDKVHDNNIKWTYDVADKDPRLGVQFNNNLLRFGILMLKENDPTNSGEHKRLTFNSDGGTNNTCVNINGSGYLFGRPPAKSEGPSRLVKVADRHAWDATMIFPEQHIRVTQHVEIVPGEQSRLLDTCLVYYKVENVGTAPQTVGLRFMLDTFIGGNDGVPFVIPGQKGLMTDARTFTEKEIPDYIEALENPVLSNPGTVAHLGLAGLKLPGVDLEPITKMIICHYPEDTGSETRYEPDKNAKKDDAQVPITGGQRPDSCVFLYWTYRKMPPGDVRHMAFTYGLGSMAVDASLVGGTQIGMTVGGAFRPGGEFTATAYLKNAKEGQKITLQLPEGLHLVQPQEATREVPLPGAEPYSQVSWRVKADANGDYTIKATSEGKTVSHAVKIKSSGLFD